MAEGAAPQKRAASRRRPADPPDPLVVDDGKADDVHGTEPPPKPTGYVAGRRMLFNGVWYEQGDPVPDAESARRIETLIANRYLRRVS